MSGSQTAEGPFRFFVRCDGELVELEPGAGLLLGRAAHCDILLDDELASREHCRIRLRDGRVDVWDLGSRNGLLVNGLPVEGEQELFHGDQLTAGRAQVTLLRRSRAPRDIVRRAGSPDDADSEVTETGDLASILEGATLRALEHQEVSLADRSAASLFAMFRSFAQRGKLPKEQLLRASRIALDLTDKTQLRSWLEQALELHTAANVPLPDSLALRFIELAGKVGRPIRGVEDYLAIDVPADGEGGIMRRWLPG